MKKKTVVICGVTITIAAGCGFGIYAWHKFETTKKKLLQEVVDYTDSQTVCHKDIIMSYFELYNNILWNINNAETFDDLNDASFDIEHYKSYIESEIRDDSIEDEYIIPNTNQSEASQDDDHLEEIPKPDENHINISENTVDTETEDANSDEVSEQVDESESSVDDTDESATSIEDIVNVPTPLEERVSMADEILLKIIDVIYNYPTIYTDSPEAIKNSKLIKTVVRYLAIVKEYAPTDYVRYVKELRSRIDESISISSTLTAEAADIISIMRNIRSKILHNYGTVIHRLTQEERDKKMDGMK